jgi:hypothetical protein
MGGLSLYLGHRELVEKMTREVDGGGRVSEEGGEGKREKRERPGHELSDLRDVLVFLELLDHAHCSLELSRHFGIVPLSEVSPED